MKTSHSKTQKNMDGSTLDYVEFAQIVDLYRSTDLRRVKNADQWTQEVQAMIDEHPSWFARYCKEHHTGKTSYGR